MEDELEYIENPEEESYEEIPSSGSPLSAALLQRAREVAPAKGDIAAKRSALMSAFDKLIEAQRMYGASPKDFSSMAGGAAGLLESQNPNVRAFGAMQAARAKQLSDQEAAKQKALLDSYQSGLEKELMSNKLLLGDRDDELKFLQAASNNDYRNLLLAAKLKGLKGSGEAGDLPVDQQNAMLAEEAGVPVFSGNDPYAGLDSVGKRQMRMQFEKQLAQEQQAASENKPTIDKIQSFLDLNEKHKDDLIGTGPLAKYVPNLSSDMQEMQSAADFLAPQMRVPGSGASSDRDVEMFKRATIGTDKSYQANKNIGTGYMISKKNQVDKADFLDSYLAVNGHLRGANQAWNRYLNDNPIFVYGNKEYKLNDNRKTWQEYFGKKSSPAQEVKIEESPVPDGIDPEDWKYMDEASKELFTKKEVSGE